MANRTLRLPHEQRKTDSIHEPRDLVVRDGGNTNPHHKGVQVRLVADGRWDVDVRSHVDRRVRDSHQTTEVVPMTDELRDILARIACLPKTRSGYAAMLIEDARRKLSEAKDIEEDLGNNEAQWLRG